MIRKTALLVIDAQAGIIEGPDIGPVYQKDDLIHTLTLLIQTARKSGIPVLYVQDLDVGEENSPEFQIHPEIAPLPDEWIIQKKATDAFHRTDLHEKLQSLGINHLVITGCKTEYCVDTTCRRATTLLYDVTLVQDGHSTTDNKILTAEQIIDHHNTNLHGLDNVDSFIVVRGSHENVFEPIHDQYR